VEAEADGEVLAFAEADGEVLVFAEADGEVLAFVVEEVTGEVEALVEVVAAELPQPANATTSIIDARTTAIVFFINYPPKLKIDSPENISKVAMILALKRWDVNMKTALFNKYLIYI